MIQSSAPSASSNPRLTQARERAEASEQRLTRAEDRTSPGRLAATMGKTSGASGFAFGTLVAGYVQGMTPRGGSPTFRLSAALGVRGALLGLPLGAALGAGQLLWGKSELGKARTEFREATKEAARAEAFAVG